MQNALPCSRGVCVLQWLSIKVLMTVLCIHFNYSVRMSNIVPVIARRCVVHLGYCPPLTNGWITNILWLYLALNRTPTIDCYWGWGSTQCSSPFSPNITPASASSHRWSPPPTISGNETNIHMYIIYTCVYMCIHVYIYMDMFTHVS